jgi:hypothetical protein
VEIFQGLAVFVPVSLAGMTCGPPCQRSKEKGRVPVRDAGDAGPWADSGRGLKRSPRPFSHFPIYFSFLFLFCFLCNFAKQFQIDFKQLFLTFVNHFPCLLHFREMFESHNSQGFW